ncbi:MAG: DUF6491 family protein [Pseudomonadales bacterium]
MKICKTVLIALSMISVAFASQAEIEKKPFAVAEKYQFDNLPVVKGFNNWSIDGWNVIDPQSLIVRTSPSTAYLLILQRRSLDLRFTEQIALSSTGSFVHAKFDTVRALDRHHFAVPISIAKIYQLKGRDQRKLVKAQILGAGETAL